MRNLCALLAFFFLVCSAARAEAESILLVDLIEADGSIVQGDKLFDNFRVQTVREFGFSFLFIGAIAVEGITRNGEHGLRFSGGLMGQGQPEGSSGFGVLLSYSVTSLDPQLRLHDVTIASGVTVANGGVQLTERVLGPDSVLLATASASAGGTFPTDPGVTEISDHQLLVNAVSAIDVQSTINLIALRTQFCTPCGRASINYIDYTFSQVPQTQAIPEPGTLLLIGMGIATGCARQKRNHGATSTTSSGPRKMRLCSPRDAKTPN